MTDSTPTVKQKRMTKRGWIILAAAGALLLGGAGAAVPAIAGQMQLESAVADLEVSEKSVEQAVAQVVKAQESVFDAGTDAVVVFDESGELVKVARAELLSDAKTLDALKLGREELKTVAGITVDANSQSSAPEQAAAPEIAKAPSPSSVEAIRTQITKNERSAKDFVEQAEKLNDEAKAITEKAESLTGLADNVLSSAAKFGADVKAFPKADAALVKTLSTKVTALTGTAGTAAENFKAYAASFDAVKKSHTDKEAAEKAEAERKAKEEAERQREQAREEAGEWGNDDGPGSGSNHGGWDGNSGNGGDSGNSGNGGDSGNSGNSGNGGNGGDSGNGGNGGNDNDNGGYTPEPPRKDASFQTGSNYVGYNGSCGYYMSHEVGYGGTSMNASHMDGLGVNWSATVNGGTVTYYICD